MITKDTYIEDLVKVPGAIRYLRKQNIQCLACGEPIWGTLEEAAKRKGHTDTDIDRFVEELNKLASASPDP